MRCLGSKARVSAAVLVSNPQVSVMKFRELMQWYLSDRDVRVFSVDREGLWRLERWLGRDDAPVTVLELTPDRGPGALADLDRSSNVDVV
jgi:hypothetical protein